MFFLFKFQIKRFLSDAEMIVSRWIKWAYSLSPTTRREFFVKKSKNVFQLVYRQQQEEFFVKKKKVKSALRHLRAAKAEKLTPSDNLQFLTWRLTIGFVWKYDFFLTNGFFWQLDFSDNWIFLTIRFFWQLDFSDNWIFLTIEFFSDYWIFLTIWFFLTIGLFFLFLFLTIGLFFSNFNFWGIFLADNWITSLKSLVHSASNTHTEYAPKTSLYLCVSLLFIFYILEKFDPND